MSQSKSGQRTSTPPGWHRVIEGLRRRRGRPQPVLLLDLDGGELMSLEASGRVQRLEVHAAPDAAYRIGNGELVVRDGTVHEVRGYNSPTQFQHAEDFMP
jgi:hypothetical protein